VDAYYGAREGAPVAMIVRAPRSWALVLIPVALGVGTFLGVTLLRSWIARDHGDAWRTLGRPIGGFAEHDVPLQVAVHDLVERVGTPATVNVCRTVANRAVTLSGDKAQTLETALEALANQVGTSVILGERRVEGSELPTILCPGGQPSDYVTIGFAQPPARAPDE
jgi:hypothetical protein